VNYFRLQSWKKRFEKTTKFGEKFKMLSKKDCTFVKIKTTMALAL